MKNRELLRFQHRLFEYKYRTCMLTFAVKQGETLGIIDQHRVSNPSLDDMLSGAWRHISGTVFWEDKEVNWTSREDAERTGVFVVGSESRLIDQLTIDENISLFRSASGKKVINPVHIDWNDVHRQTQALFEFLDVDMDTTQHVGDLPGSMRLIVEIAKAVALGGRLIILSHVHDVFPMDDLSLLEHVMSRMMEQGMSFIITSNTPFYMLGLASRIMVYENDMLTRSLDKQELKTQVRTVPIAGRSSAVASPEISIVGRGFQESPSYEFGLSPGKPTCVMTLESRLYNDIGKWLYCPEAQSFKDDVRIVINRKPHRVTDSSKAMKLGIGYISDESISSFVPVFSPVENITLPYFNKKKGLINPIGLKSFNNFIQKQVLQELERCKCPIDKVGTTGIAMEELQMQQKLVVAFYRLRACHLKLLILDRLSVFDSPSDQVLLNTLIHSMLEQNTSVLIVADHMLRFSLLPQDCYLFIQDRFAGRYDASENRYGTI